MTTKAYKTVLNILIIFSIFILSSKCNEDSTTVSEQEEHFEAEGLILYDESGNMLLDYFQAVSDDTLFVSINNLTSVLQVKFYDGDKNEIDAPYEDDDHTFGWQIDNTAIVEVVRVVDDEWKFQLRGLLNGQTQIEFQVLHLGHADFRTSKIPVVVE